MTTTELLMIWKESLPPLNKKQLNQKTLSEEAPKKLTLGNKEIWNYKTDSTNIETLKQNQPLFKKNQKDSNKKKKTWKDLIDNFNNTTSIKMPQKKKQEI